jgi:hypothetical protein
MLTQGATQRSVVVDMIHIIVGTKFKLNEKIPASRENNGSH